MRARATEQTHLQRRISDELAHHYRRRLVERSSQVAAEAGVNLQTLRYYERRGLLAEPDRSLGGHRLYPADAVTVLRVIKAAQRIGFTLDEVADLLEAGQHRRHRPDAGLRARAQQKLTEVEAKIADLQTIAGTQDLPGMYVRVTGRQAGTSHRAAGKLETGTGSDCCRSSTTRLASGRIKFATAVRSVPSKVHSSP